jgi:hypothetical protein
VFNHILLPVDLTDKNTPAIEAAKTLIDAAPFSSSNERPAHARWGAVCSIPFRLLLQNKRNWRSA